MFEEVEVVSVLIQLLEMLLFVVVGLFAGVGLFAFVEWLV